MPLPALGVAAKFILVNGTRQATIKYGPKAVKQAQKQIAKREKALLDKAKPAGSTKNQQEAARELKRQEERAERLLRENKGKTYRDIDGEPLDEVPLRFDMKAGGLLSDDRAAYKDGGFPDLNKDGKTTYADVLIGRGVREQKSIGGLVTKLFKLAKKKKPKEVKEQDIDKILDSLSDEQMEKLTPIEIEQLLDMDLAKSGVDNIPAKSTKKDIDDILDNLTDKEIKNLTPTEREQLLDLELDKYGIDGRKSKAHGGMLPDEDMEDNYTKFIMEEALTEDEEDMLASKLEQDEELAMIFDKVIEVAQEFAGSGPVEGPGSGVSDSIPARLSDGEFVFTAKAVEEIGEDTLMSMMKDAEAKADERQGFAEGEMVEQQESKSMLSSGVMQEDEIAEDELKKRMVQGSSDYVRS